MNESTEELLATLEQVTGVDAPEDASEEVAMLRESWLAFGQLLDATDEEPPQPVVQPRSVRRAGLPVRFIAALAASLLIAFGAWTFLNRGSNSNNPVVAPTELRVPVPATEDVAEVEKPSESMEIVDEFAWEDSFDENLAATSQAIRSAQAGWSGSNRRYSVLLDQFEQFDEELSDGSL